MNKEIEEAINHLEFIIKRAKENLSKEYYYGEQFAIRKQIESTETILNYIKDLKARCKELIKEKQKLTSALVDSTPNSVIREELKEAEKKYKKWRTHIGRLRYEGKIELCEKLLKEGEK